MGSGDKPLSKEEIKIRITELQADVKDMQAGRKPKKDYFKKVRELMYWRRRQTQSGKE